MIRDHSERLLTIRPFSQAALKGLATFAFAANDYEAAARCCAKLVEFTPNHFERWFNLGVAYQKLTRLEQAAQAYSEAVRVRPEAKQAFVNLGTRRELGVLRRRRVKHERALQLAPDIPRSSTISAPSSSSRGRRKRRRSCIHGC
jgi:Flp pilus assembly protein TadD